MIVQIKEYSFKSGNGVAVDPKGNEIKFSYKQLKNEKAIPVGKKAEVTGKKFNPATKTKIILFYILKLVEIIRGKLWR